MRRKDPSLQNWITGAIAQKLGRPQLADIGIDRSASFSECHEFMSHLREPFSSEPSFSASDPRHFDTVLSAEFVDGFGNDDCRIRRSPLQAVVPNVMPGK